MAKLQSLGFIFTLIISLGLVASHVQAREKRPPNVVVFLVDDLGPHELVCYASRFHDTPNIDALAGKGMRFTHAHSGGRLPGIHKKMFSRVNLLAATEESRVQ